LASLALGGPVGVDPSPLAVDPALPERPGPLRRRRRTITPDGPKGPALVFKPGAIALSRLTGRPFLLLGIRYASCFRFGSWDRFAMPLPFSRVDITVGREAVPAEGEGDAAVAARLQERLRAISADPA